jgi:hypothetical protein
MEVYMLEKEYYRLSELSRHSKISLEDYQYFIENYKETLYFRLHDQPIVIVEQFSKKELTEFNEDSDNLFQELTELTSTLDEEETQYQGVCVGHYSGLARLSRQDKKTLLREGTVRCFHVRIDDIKGLKRENKAYPFSTTLPNKYLVQWGELHPESQYGLESFLLNKDSGQLDICIKTINFDDLLVPIGMVEYIEKCFKPREEKSQEAFQADISNKAVTKNRFDDFQELLIDILTKHPAYSNKEVWKLLKNESEDFGDYRTFDKYNLLQEMSGDDIEWEDKKGKPRKSISAKGLANRLTSARKLINNN